jgi:hydrogenase nickel incorporation protein HypB
MMAAIEPIAKAQARRVPLPLIIALSGNSGCGKTSLIRAAAARLHAGVGAIVATPAAAHAGNRLSDFVCEVHLVSDEDLDFTRLQEIARQAFTPVLFAETVSPLSFPDGAHERYRRVVVFSTAAGDEKVFEYPKAVADADVVILTKVDLLPHVPFDLPKFTTAVHQLNPSVPIVTVSVLQGTGMDVWEGWLRAQLEQVSMKDCPAEDPRSEWFVG